MQQRGLAVQPLPGLADRALHPRGQALVSGHCRLTDHAERVAVQAGS
ncbi:MAG TPA: hypothetical protein VHZ97_28870 [Pseudonocardiaceae bacterium]|nr:hypothetical protein [Pseudonocardiaceae bacterium]